MASLMALMDKSKNGLGVEMAQDVATWEDPARSVGAFSLPFSDCFLSSSP